MSQLLQDRLQKLVDAYPKLFAELRGSGLLLGVRCHIPAGDFVTKLRANGLLCLTAGDNVMRILPPLIVGEREIDEALAIMDKVAKEWPPQ
jgi:acetylornithine/N-succinyldiaminopimelate aminotransferase